MNSVTLSSESVPVRGEYDVVVVGGGPAGVSAGIAAARLGKRTLIIEQFNCLGGVATAGGHGHICLYSAWDSNIRVVGGVTYEIARRVADAGFGVANAAVVDFEVEGMKLVLEQMASEAGVELLYHSFFLDAIVENNVVKGVVIASKNGREAVLAKRIIDCTGDGDVAFRAGCGFSQGNDMGNTQPMTLMFTVGGVDWGKVEEWRTDYKMAHVWEEAQNNGDMRPFQKVIMGFWHTQTRPDQVGINFTHINFVDATKVEDLTSATLEGRKQAYESIEVFRKYVPGMEDCYMVSTPNTVGIRETRRINGLYTLTKDDIMNEMEFDDSIGYGSFFIDIHNCDGPGMDKKAFYPHSGFKYQIPYRILVPKDVDNLFVAGRCASCTHEALGSLRVMPQCGVMGEAAAVGASLSIDAGVSPGSVDFVSIRKALRDTGNIVCADDIGKISGVAVS